MYPTMTFMKLVKSIRFESTLVSFDQSTIVVSPMMLFHPCKDFPVTVDFVKLIIIIVKKVQNNYINYRVNVL